MNNTGIIENATINEILKDNEKTENNNQTEIENNNTTENNNQTEIENNITTSNNGNNPSEVINKDIDNGNLEKENNGQNHINLIKHTTGNNTAIGLGLLLFLTIFLIIKYKRD